MIAKSEKSPVHEKTMALPVNWKVIEDTVQEYWWHLKAYGITATSITYKAQQLRVILLQSL